MNTRKENGLTEREEKINWRKYDKLRGNEDKKKNKNKENQEKEEV